MLIQFSKYQGTGNDFVVIDNRHANIALTTEQIATLCNRHFGIGADGLMLLETLSGYDFAMKYYNADGRASSMCGNGGRCLVQFAFDNGIKNKNYHFIASDGEHKATRDRHGFVALQMQNVNCIIPYNNDFILNTGSPHYVQIVKNIHALNVYELGKQIRYSNDFKTQGINVNFIEKTTTGIFVRTYERGVEDETYSCGTGATAAAIIIAEQCDGAYTTKIETKGGGLEVSFTKQANNFTDIYLKGAAIFVFSGEVIV